MCAEWLNFDSGLHNSLLLMVSHIQLFIYKIQHLLENDFFLSPLQFIDKTFGSGQYHT